MSGSLLDGQPPATAAKPVRPFGRTVKRSLLVVCRFVLAAVFLLAGAAKVMDQQAFADQLLLHSFLPSWIAWTAAAWIPWLELVCGLCLALGYAVREAAAVIGCLLILFAVYGVLNRTEVDCGCLPFARQAVPLLNGWWHLGLDLGLLLGSLAVVWSPGAETTDPLNDPCRTSRQGSRKAVRSAC